MAFVDIFNYKKYFSKKGDATVARVGHVNKLADRITAPISVTQKTSNITAVSIDAYAGVVTMAANLTSNATFTVNNSFVLNSSVVQVTLEYASAADITDRVDLAISDVADGSFKVTVITSNTSPAPIGPYKIHFLVVS